MIHRYIDATIDIDGVKVPVKVQYRAFYDLEGDVSVPHLTRRFVRVEIEDVVAEPGPLKIQAEGLAADDEAIYDACLADSREFL